MNQDLLISLYNKCSAVAEMGDRLATKDMGQEVGAAAPNFFFGGGGELDPHIIQRRLGRGLPLYQMTS